MEPILWTLLGNGHYSHAEKLSICLVNTAESLVTIISKLKNFPENAELLGKLQNVPLDSFTVGAIFLGQRPQLQYTLGIDNIILPPPLTLSHDPLALRI